MNNSDVDSGEMVEYKEYRSSFLKICLLICSVYILLLASYLLGHMKVEGFVVALLGVFVLFSGAFFEGVPLFRTVV